MSGDVKVSIPDLIKFQQEYEEKLKDVHESNVVSFGNFLLKRYGVMVHSNDGTNQPIFQREVNDADLSNWKEEIGGAVFASKHLIGDKVRVFLMPEGAESFPGFAGRIIAIHNYTSKIKYDVEIKFAGEFSTRIYNIDEVLVSELPS